MYPQQLSGEEESWTIVGGLSNGDNNVWRKTQPLSMRRLQFIWTWMLYIFLMPCMHACHICPDDHPHPHSDNASPWDTTSCFVNIYDFQWFSTYLFIIVQAVFISTLKKQKTKNKNKISTYLYMCVYIPIMLLHDWELYISKDSSFLGRVLRILSSIQLIINSLSW
jgi:hypothetical protein